MKPISVYDRGTRKRLAFLQNAYDISYNKKINSLWTGSFKLPISDDKKKHCQPFNIVEMWEVDNDGDDVRVGLFRIMPTKQNPFGGELYDEYKLEHVLGVLIDDMMVGWTEVGGVGVGTEVVINTILASQLTENWVLDTCDYNFEFLYGWQEENLLSALFSITAPFFDSNYIWSFDTTTYPWRLSLMEANLTPVTEIRYRKNLKGLIRNEDPTNIITRLYPYGYGDGDNKLNIAAVNSGVLYLESTNVSKYGIISQSWTDPKYTVAEALKATAQAMLARLEKPAVTYDYDVAAYGGGSFNLGATVRIVHNDMDELMIVREVGKNNVSGNPQNTEKIVFGKGTVDLGDSFSSLVEKQRISETYSQGAESIYADSLTDNADPEYPLEVTFKIPDTAVHVNEILLDVRLTPFRAYSKGVADGGSVSKSSGGGGGTVRATTEDGRVDKTTGDGGLEYMTTGEGYLQSSWYSEGDLVDWHFDGVNWHSHQGRKHNHTFTIPDHDHKMQISPHDHTINLEDHYHWIDIEDHEHPIQYGLYLGPSATSMSVYLDDVLIGTYNTSYISDLNLIPSISQDANGKVLRGAHTLKIVPNGLTRVECSFLIRLFTNSIGAGQY